MKSKFLALVALVVVAGAFFAIRAARHSPQLSGDTRAAQVASTANARTKVVAYYFHGNVRCPTCKKIESMSRDVLLAEFQDRLKSGQLIWQPLNVEAPENEHYFTDYKLITWSLVLVTYENGRQKDFKVLSDTWKLVRDEPGFKQYVRGEVQSALGRI